MPSLKSLEAFRALEACSGGKASHNDTGELLEFQHLELRVHPPNVDVNNSLFTDRSVITIDSANRPGTLVEVVQWLTEMGLNVRKARISSDGGWFVDEFVTDRIADKTKENEIKHVLGTGSEYLTESGLEEVVFELSGVDRAGLLAEAVSVLQSQGCEVQSAAMWTAHGHVALVVSVVDSSSTHTALTNNTALSNTVLTNNTALASTNSQEALRPDPAPAHNQQQSAAATTQLGSETTNGSVQALGSNTQQGMGHNGGYSMASEKSSDSWVDVEGTVRGKQPKLFARRAQPQVHDYTKLQNIEKQLKRVMDQGGASHTGPHTDRPPSNSHTHTSQGHVQFSIVRGGAVHFERRLHRLLQLRDEGAWAGSDRQAVYEAMVGDGHADRPVWTRPTHTACHVLPPTPSASAPTDVLDRAVASALQAQHAETAAAAAPPQPPQPPRPPPRLSLSSAMSVHTRTGLSTSERTDPWAVNGNGIGNGGGGGGNVGRRVDVYTGQACELSMSGRHSPCLLVSPKYCKPDVSVRYNERLKYWLVEIRCKDRKKLLFDTVCTLADLDYDIFHASVDTEGDTAHQVYYIRRCNGDSSWCRSQAAKLWYLLEASIQRRFPRGVKMRIESWQQYDLAALTAAWRDSGLLITRAKVRSCTGWGPKAGLRGVTNTFYLLDARTGSAPDPYIVQAACVGLGGIVLPPPAHLLPIATTSAVIARVSPISSPLRTHALSHTHSHTTHSPLRGMSAGVAAVVGAPGSLQAKRQQHSKASVSVSVVTQNHDEKRRPESVTTGMVTQFGHTDDNKGAGEGVGNKVGQQGFVGGGVAQRVGAQGAFGFALVMQRKYAESPSSLASSL